MPYTPPSQRSPASSGPSSPEGSRRPSFHLPHHGSSRPVLPRSASYLTRQRRAPPAPQPRTGQPSPEATSEDLKGMANGGSVRQSPPPVTGDHGMPNGAIMSPPDSASDDDDLPEVRTRKIEDLKGLHDAISQIPQQRARLPSGGADNNAAPDAGDLHVLPKQVDSLVVGMQHSFSTGSLVEPPHGAARRFNHTRSATEPHISITKSSSSSATGSDEETDEDRLNKPQMVRKKSGELVRPALRPASRRRPSSMPGTPTYSKAVHFDSHLEHVRHFLQVDRPLAVSAGSSPVDNYDSDTEYPFSGEERSAGRGPPFEWELIMTNFPLETPVRKAQPVRLERVWLSNDQKSLVGSVAVANLAFEKLIACRFTLDYWKTTSEVTAEYVGEIRPAETPMSQDRFHFTIKLSDLANLELKTLYFCIRYNVSGQEHWDNNNGINFQVDFRKKMLPRNGKRGVGSASRPHNGLPKSSRRSGQKPKQSSVSDEFGENREPAFERSIQDYLGESGPAGVRLKSVKSSGDIPSDNLSGGLSGPSGQFALRYDFGDSLSRAIQSARSDNASKSDTLYMKSRKKPESPAALKTDTAETRGRQTWSAKVGPSGSAPAASSPADSPSAAMSSATYQEIVNKWCFYSPKPRAPQNRQQASSDSGSSTASGEGSPVQMGNYHHTHGGTQQSSLHSPDSNSYFGHSSVLLAVGASPAESPLGQSGHSAPGRPATQPHAGTDNFGALAGTSPNEYYYQHSQDRFPFHGSEAYASPAIRG